MEEELIGPSRPSIHLLVRGNEWTKFLQTAGFDAEIRHFEIPVDMEKLVPPNSRGIVIVSPRFCNSNESTVILVQDIRISFAGPIVVLGDEHAADGRSPLRVRGGANFSVRIAPAAIMQPELGQLIDDLLVELAMPQS